MTTLYRFDIECDDLGEYDAVVVQRIAQMVTQALGDASLWSYSLTITRRRADER